MFNKVKKLIERYSRVSAEHSAAASMNDEFSKGVCSVADGVVADLKSLEKEMNKLKLFKCSFEVDTGYSYHKKVVHVFAHNEDECNNLLSNCPSICPYNDCCVLDLVVEKVEIEHGLIM